MGPELGEGLADPSLCHQGHPWQNQGSASFQNKAAQRQQRFPATAYTLFVLKILSKSH